MNEIFASIAEAIRRRTASATLGSYLFFWVAWHWQGLYVTFFVDQDNIYKAQHGLLKNQYVNEYFFGYHGLGDWYFYAGIIVPAILTYLFIWWMPLILLKMYNREQWFKIEKRLIRIEQEKRVQEDRKELAKETTKAIREEVKAVEAKKTAAEVDPKILWDEEFNELNDKERTLLGAILRSVYRYYGYIMYEGTGTERFPEFTLDANALRFADSRGIISIVDQETVKLTAKGRYFASLYKDDI